MNRSTKLQKEIAFKRLIHRTDYVRNKNRVKFRGKVNGKMHLKHEVVKSVVSIILYEKKYEFWSEPRIEVYGVVVGVPDIAVSTTQTFYEITDKGRGLDKKNHLYDKIPKDLWQDVVEIDCQKVPDTIYAMYFYLKEMII